MIVQSCFLRRPQLLTDLAFRWLSGAERLRQWSGSYTHGPWVASGGLLAAAGLGQVLSKNSPMLDVARLWFPSLLKCHSQLKATFHKSPPKLTGNLLCRPSLGSVIAHACARSFKSLVLLI